MPGPLIMPAGAPVLTAANGGVTSGSGAAMEDAGTFENMLNAGLVGGAAAATETVLAARAAGPQPEAMPEAHASGAAHGTRGDPQNACGDDGASDLLAALLAFGLGAGATASPVADASKRDAAAPADTNPHPETSAKALAAVVTPTMPGRWNANAQTAEPPAADGASDGLGTVAAFSAGPTPAYAADTAVRDAGQREGAVAVASPGLTPRPMPGIPRDPVALPARIPPEFTSAGTRTAEPSADTVEGLPPSRQQPSTRHGEPRNATENVDATGGPIESPPHGPVERLLERAAGGTVDPDPAAGIGRMLRTDRAPGQDAQLPAREHAGPALYLDAGRGVADDMRSAAFTIDRPADRQAERDAGRAPDPAAWIDTILRPDMAPRPDAPLPAAGRAGPAPVLHVDHSLGGAEWQREFGAQVSVLVSRREPQAEIRLNPPQLGPVEIRIGVQGDQVSLAFSAPQPETRAAIENTLPQLRELFAGSGLALGHASVSAESSGQRSPAETRPCATPFRQEEPIAVNTAPGLARVAVRLVDTFA